MITILSLNKQLIVKVLVRHASHLGVREHIHRVLHIVVFSLTTHRNAAIVQKAACSWPLELLKASVFLEMLHIRKLLDLVTLSLDRRRLEWGCARI